MGHHAGTPGARCGGQKSLRRVCPKGGRGSKVTHRGGTMGGEQGPPTSSSGTAVSSSPSTSTSTVSSSSTSNGNTNTSASVSTNTSASSSSSSSSNGTGRQTVPQISVYSGIPDRQTVQVIQQALHRQPNTAAQYLQQMYAAQQQHLMLQTAALQQQHLSTAQLQSLAAVQQASIAAGRQSSSQNGTTSSQTGSSQTTINLTTSPAAAQLISRAQSVSSTPTGISQQAVLLGNPTSPALTASQAQMYLRAQMAQQSNLVQVARSLGRAVPLSPQLIFTPTATVTALQSEASTQSAAQQSASSQVQNLAIRSQQGAASSSSSSSTTASSSNSTTQTQTQVLQALSLKQTPIAIQPTALLKNSTQGTQGLGAKSHPPEAPAESGKKGENASEARAVTMSRSVASVSSHPLIAPAYAQIQPHSLVKQQQFVSQQQQSQTAQRTPSQLLQTASIQPHLHPQTLAIHPGLASQAAGQPGSIAVLPKPASHQHSSPSQQATIFHSTISPHALSHHSSHAALGSAKAQPVQLTAINLQIQPTPSQAARLGQECKDKPTSLVVRETCSNLSSQQATSASPQRTKAAEQPKADTGTATCQTQESTKRISASSETASTAMTSGNESEAPTMVGCTAQNGENRPPQAIVKPQVLTHVIEGFVIQEGAEPFPVARSPVQSDSPKKPDQQVPSDLEKTPVHNPHNNTDSEPEDTNQQELKDQEEEPKLRCEFCGWVDFAYKFKGTKRFCSMVCAKRYNVGCTKRIGLFHPERTKTNSRWKRRSHSGGRRNTDAKKQKIPIPQQTQSGPVASPIPSQPSQGESSPCSDMSSYEEPPSPLSAASSGPTVPQPEHSLEQQANCGRELPLLTQHFLPCDPTKWNVEEVYKFIRSLPGCQEIADEFRSQEIDGQAMLLLKEDHLMSAMNIKLGPALKIYARICMLKDS
ncbi:polyhomeotic-like protein 2b isoform X2 [Denticeps clupeoides]|uniref:polyhomeotic-like protein 2b isoform X2 n=1 Tax=Denticeps clupeoides TaxID=299321 RepID=UPI0010A389BD|nr:polyhomeotic-like protein 2 isoform X2 [Denticeps clupeoides]